MSKREMEKRRRIRNNIDNTDFSKGNIKGEEKKESEKNKKNQC